MKTAIANRAHLRVLTTGGIEFLDLTHTEASIVGRHWNAIRHYLEAGDSSGLHQLRGVRVAGHELETRFDVIEWHAVRGDVTFESIYDEVV